MTHLNDDFAAVSAAVAADPTEIDSRIWPALLRSRRCLAALFLSLALFPASPAKATNNIGIVLGTGTMDEMSTVGFGSSVKITE